MSTGGFWQRRPWCNTSAGGNLCNASSFLHHQADSAYATPCARGYRKFRRWQRRRWRSLNIFLRYSFCIHIPIELLFLLRRPRLSLRRAEAVEFVRQKYCAIQGDGQSAMTAADHDCTHNQFGERVHPTRKREIGLPQSSLSSKVEEMCRCDILLATRVKGRLSRMQIRSQRLARTR